MNGCIITLALCFDDPHGDLPIKLQTKASNLEEYVYTFKLIMTLRGVFYNHLHIELHACTGHAHSPGNFINIKVYKNKLIN